MDTTFTRWEETDHHIIQPFAHQLCEGGGEIDNPDQRLTADVSSMLASYELIMEADLFILPAATAYYAYKVHLQPFVDPNDPPISRRTVRQHGSVLPACLASSFCPSSTSFSWTLSPRGRQSLRRGNGPRIGWPSLIREGDFRYLHMNLREHAESVALQVCRTTTLPFLSFRW